MSGVLRKLLSMWSSPEIVALCGIREWRKLVVERMMLILLTFIEELLVCCAVVGVFERMGGLADKIRIFCCAAGTSQCVARHAC